MHTLCTHLMSFQTSSSAMSFSEMTLLCANKDVAQKALKYLGTHQVPNICLWH